MFDAVVKMGFKEIEVGFPSASQPDFDFVRVADRGGPDPRRRHDPGADPVPPGADRADLRVPGGRAARHRALLQLDVDPAAARGVRPGPGRDHRHRGQRRQAVPQARAGRWATPTSATSTRPRASPAPSPTTRLEICEAVMDVIEPTPDRPIILNLPATVEMYTPNVYADVIEWFHRHVSRPRSVVLSLHPHNDRGCARRRGRARRHGRRRPGRGHAVRQRRAHRQRRRRHAGHEPVQPGRRPRARHHRHRRAAPRGRVLQPPARPLRATRTSATWSTRRSRAPTRTRSRRAWRPCPPTTSSGRSRTCRSIPEARRAHVRGRHPGQQPVGQGWRGLHHEGRARLRAAPPAADRVLQDDPDHHRGHAAPRSRPAAMWDAFQSEYLPGVARHRPREPRAALRRRRPDHHHRPARRRRRRTTR